MRKLIMGFLILLASFAGAQTVGISLSSTIGTNCYYPNANPHGFRTNVVSQWSVSQPGIFSNGVVLISASSVRVIQSGIYQITYGVMHEDCDTINDHRRSYIESHLNINGVPSKKFWATQYNDTKNTVRTWNAPAFFWETIRHWDSGQIIVPLSAGDVLTINQSMYGAGTKSGLIALFYRTWDIIRIGD